MVTAGFFLCIALLQAVVFVYVLRPLWRDNRTLCIALFAVLPLATMLLYRIVGTPAALDPAQRAQPATMAEAITRLEAELQRDPNQVDGLRLLARAYLQQEQPAKARDAYDRALKLAPEDTDLLAESAQTRALANPDRSFDDTAIAQLREALRLQPMHQRARWFLGVAQRQRGDHAGAVATWQPLLEVVDASTAAALRPQIDAARADAGLPALPLPNDAATAGTAPPTDAAPSANALAIRLTLDPALAARHAGASVFVIARMPGGPPMPIAVEKHPINALPPSITLDDADSPMPTQKLSALQEVEVFARISQSGDAMRQESDIDSKPVRVKLPASEAVELRLP